MDSWYLYGIYGRWWRRHGTYQMCDLVPFLHCDDRSSFTAENRVFQEQFNYSYPKSQRRHRPCRWCHVTQCPSPPWAWNWEWEWHESVDHGVGPFRPSFICGIQFWHSILDQSEICRKKAPNSNSGPEKRYTSSHFHDKTITFSGISFKKLASHFGHKIKTLWNF